MWHRLKCTHSTIEDDDHRAYRFQRSDPNRIKNGRDGSKDAPPRELNVRAQRGHQIWVNAKCSRWFVIWTIWRWIYYMCLGVIIIFVSWLTVVVDTNKI